MDLALAIWQLNPAAAYRLTDDKTAILEWLGPGAQPTGQQLQDAWTAYQAAQQRAAQDAAAERTAVVSLVQSCVGVTWPNLTAGQKQSLIVALLYKFGALDRTLTVQPLGQWL